MLDIVIVNYNATDYLLHCLRSVYSSLQNLPARVIVQDNDSKDGVERVRTAFPQVLLWKNTYNMGFSKAVNKGVKQGDAPYVVLLNPDTFVPDDFFRSVLRYMEKNPDIGIMGPKILNRDGSVQGSARAFPTPLTAFFGRTSLFTRWFPNNPITRKNVLTDRCDGINTMEVDWVSGACMVVKRKALDDVGLMDERFFMYWEDADWCKRMWQSGWKVVYFPQAHIVHEVGGSSEKLLLRSTVEFHRSSYRLFEKYASLSPPILSTVVSWGLALRLFFVLFSYGIGPRANGLKRRTGSRDAVSLGQVSSEVKVEGPVEAAKPGLKVL